MTVENLDRANKIQGRLKELNMMKAWIEKCDGIYIIASGRSINNSIPVSDDMRTVLHGLCLGEIAKFEKEFEEL